MLKRKMTYTDYNGNERTEDFYFNLSKAELTEMQLSEAGGMTAFIQKIVDTQDNKKIVELFKELILKAYGEKSLDGKRFIKNKELSDAFAQTEAYSDLFMELATDSKAAAEFVNGIIPSDLADKVSENGGAEAQFDIIKSSN